MIEAQDRFWRVWYFDVISLDAASVQSHKSGEAAKTARRQWGQYLSTNRNRSEVVMDRTIVNSSEAPSPVGPYSQGVTLDGWIWTSGQVALDPASGSIVGSDAASQADLTLRNIVAI